jgi:hypothetical protein
MNEENLKKKELFLCSVKDLKEEWTKEEMLSLLREDWEGFGKTEEVRYGRDGIPLGEPFWSEGLKRYTSYLQGLDGQRKGLSLRYIGSLVGDFHRNLLAGGIFYYPADTQDPTTRQDPTMFGIFRLVVQHTDACANEAHVLSLQESEEPSLLFP